MKKYDLVISLSLEELIQVVNEAIKVGYYPKGGMQLVEGKYVQTIYLRDEDIESEYKLKKDKCKHDLYAVNQVYSKCRKCNIIVED